MKSAISFSLLQNMPRMSQHLGINLRVMRDDLFPMTGGGNKARKIIKIMQIAETHKCDALVTTGGAQSNHARVTASAAAQRGWRCKLILHGDPDSLLNPEGNLLLMLLSGAEIEIVQPDDIASAMKTAMQTFKAEGRTPFEIPGGGHLLAGAIAFVEAAEEVQTQCQEDDWYPDWVILPSGTGTTQAGLMVGFEKLEWKTKVLGISVARRNPRGREIVEQSYRELRSYLGLSDLCQAIDFRDNWVGDGYEKANETVFSTIYSTAKMEGIILDPTYTGKAFTALIALVNAGEIPANSNVLFWHTGGLMNLLSSRAEFLLKSL